MTQDKKIFQNQGIVLRVSSNIDPEKFDIKVYRTNVAIKIKETVVKFCPFDPISSSLSCKAN